MERATYQLPGAAFAEREGSYVNYADRLQSFTGPFVRRPACGSKGSVYWQLLGMPGCTIRARVLNEIADEISFFAAAAGAIPPVGVDLKSQSTGRRDQLERQIMFDD